MAILGTKITAATSGSAQIVANSGGTLPNQRAHLLGTYVAPEPGYVTRLGVFARRLNLGGKAYLGIWAVDSAGAPTALLARTAQLTAAASYADLAGNVVWSDPDLAGALTAVRLESGQRFALGLITNISGVEVAALPGSALHHRRNLNANALPSDPFSATSVLTDLPMSLYAEFTPDTKPTATLSTPANAAALNTTTPTFVGTFTDPESGTPTFDKLRAYALEIRRSSDNALMWGGSSAYFVASSAERAANQFTRLYAGTALVAGPTYTWRAQVLDDSLMVSDWTATRTFTINPLGQVDTAFDGVPNSKVDALTTGVSYTGRWFHPTGLAANAFQLRILRQGAVVKLSAEVVPGGTIASSALPGTPVTLVGAWGTGTLQPGSYTYQIRMRATDNQWSPWSEPPRAYSVNAPPTTPSNLQPPSGASSTSRPLLEWNIFDPDADDVFGIDDQSEIEITRPNGTIVTVTTSNYDATRGVGFFQTTATEFPTNGTYKWRVRGRDLSAIAAGGEYGLGQWAPLRTLDYVAGPVVTITNPTEGETEATSVPTVTWTTTGQVRFRVRAYLADQPSAFKSQDVTSAVGSFQIPAGWLTNNGNYDLTVDVWNGSNQQGTSLRRRFAVSYPAPVTPTNLQASPVMMPRSLEADAVLLAWDPTTYPPGEFAGYVLRRRLVTEGAEEATVIRTITTPGQVRWTDYWAPANVGLIYGISQLRRFGADVLDSAITEVTSEIALSTPVLNSAIDGTLRHVMRWLSTGLSGEFTRPETAQTTWGGEGKPTLVTVPARYGKETTQLEITVRNDDLATLYEHIADIDALRQSGHPLCVRFERPGERIFCRVVRAPWKRGSAPGSRTFRFDLEEIAYVEGETPSV